MDRERVRHQLLVEPAIDIVLDALAALVRDDIALGLDRRGLEHEVLHPLRLEPDAEREVARGQGQLVVGPIDPGRGVRFAARALDEAIELTRRQALGLAEHQVLEQVRHAGRARALVARADAKPGLERDDRCALVDRGDQAEAVAQAVALGSDTATDRSFGLELPGHRHLVRYYAKLGSTTRPAASATAASAGSGRNSSLGARIPNGPVLRAASCCATHAPMTALAR